MISLLGKPADTAGTRGFRRRHRHRVRDIDQGKRPARKVTILTHLVTRRDMVQGDQRSSDGSEAPRRASNKRPQQCFRTHVNPLRVAVELAIYLAG